MNPSTEPVCHLDSLLPERPVAALVEGRQVAVVPNTEVTARMAEKLSPRCRAAGIVIALVGDRGAVTDVA